MKEYYFNRKKLNYEIKGILWKIKQILCSVSSKYSSFPCYLLTPWSRVLPEKLKRPELLKKFPAFYGTRRFIIAYTRARHLSLS
jgi:hypothetical protein